MFQTLTSSTCPSFWQLYVASGGFGIRVFLLDQLPYQAIEPGLPQFWNHCFPSPRPTAGQRYIVIKKTETGARYCISRQRRPPCDAICDALHPAHFALHLIVDAQGHSWKVPDREQCACKCILVRVTIVRQSIWEADAKLGDGDEEADLRYRMDIAQAAFASLSQI